ncbi:MAG: hypothetical protein K2H63_04815 [Paramuribaculum sp.]|nr:hypothetical protein [Paramuribaculum sp.]
MNIIYRLVVNTVFVCLVLSACDSKTSYSNDPTGKWSCKVSTRDIVGTEYLILSSDSSLEMVDIIRYSASNDRWGMSVDARIETFGKWNTRNDSLIFLLYKTDICTDSTSFNINMNVATSASSVKSSEKIKDLMRADFCKAVYEELSDLYDKDNGNQINLGKIEFLAQDSMVLTNGANSTVLVRQY